MRVITPPADFKSGTEANLFRTMLEVESKNYPVQKFSLNLSDVFYMDSDTFRIIFDYMYMFSEVIPPKKQHVIDMYNDWLDSKKCLAKMAPPCRRILLKQHISLETNAAEVRAISPVQKIVNEGGSVAEITRKLISLNRSLAAEYPDCINFEYVQVTKHFGNGIYSEWYDLWATTKDRT